MLFEIPSCILILLLFLTTSSTAQDNCPSSSCGNVRISYPFRLTSSPKSCGYDSSSFDLECHNNETIFKVGTARYIVRDINYATFSIWMVDPSISTANANLSSCPVYPTDIASWPYIYVVEGDGIAEESCLVDHVIWSSRAKGNSSITNPSLAGIYGDLSNGVELSWFIVHCGDCPRFGECLLEDSRITCKLQCKDDVNWSIGDVNIYGAYIVVAYGELIGLRFVIGFVLLMVLVASQWRKRHDLPL
ncbi:hypothetical protein SASPL_107515 [Salvia splendens]|uniref:RING-type E3 ubiquitin transferase n=1 Tax=Salvia splendens TaxID=180675 RepID=A0A8X9A7D0_SALSN|nr:hypothetical protein SASPL_107515 [Salvia splendens]